MDGLFEASNAPPDVIAEDQKEGTHTLKVSTRLAARIAAVLITIGLAGVLSPSAQASPPPRNAEKFALLVGVQTYKGKMRTYGGLGDTIDMRETLIRNGWPEGHIRVLTDRNATAANIRAGFRWLASVSSPRSFSVFGYSGHVKQMGGDKDRDREKVDEYLWPYDHKYISDRELTNAMNSVSGWLWVNIAGCEAGGFDEGISSPYHLFTGSSQEWEKSYEDPQERNSVFNLFMIDHAMLRMEADANNDDAVSIQEAWSLARRNAHEMTRGQRKGAQTPYLAGGSGEWFLRAPAPKPSPPKRHDPPQEPPQECMIFCLPS